MSDVIFNGSTERKPVNMAEVTLVFDNSRHIMNVDFEEVEVTRRLHRQSGEGEYFINKTPCRLKDIVNLVMDTGLGRDSLSIISQEIFQLLRMQSLKSEELYLKRQPVWLSIRNVKMNR